jgi:uncharacterized membrane protein YdjX (TVP38/TMEM64 family)
LNYRKNFENVEQYKGGAEGREEVYGSDLLGMNKGYTDGEAILAENYGKESPGENHSWMRPLILLAIVSGVCLLFYQTGLWQFFGSKERILNFLDSMGVWDEVAYVFLEAVQVVIPAIPGVLLNMLGGYLYGTFSGCILSTIGTTIGGYIVFSISRRFGRVFINKFFDKKIIRHLDNISHNKGRFKIFFLFLIPGFPKDYLCYTLGYLSTAEFLAISGVGRLLGTVLETLGGAYIRHGQHREFFILAGVALIIILLTLVFKKRIEKWLRRIHIMAYRRRKADLLRRKMQKTAGPDGSS